MRRSRVPLPRQRAGLVPAGVGLLPERPEPAGRIGDVRRTKSLLRRHLHRQRIRLSGDLCPRRELPRLLLGTLHQQRSLRAERLPQRGVSLHFRQSRPVRRGPRLLPDPRRAAGRSRRLRAAGCLRIIAPPTARHRENGGAAVPPFVSTPRRDSRVLRSLLRHLRDAEGCHLPSDRGSDCTTTPEK
jgi:hypothetical protein